MSECFTKYAAVKLESTNAPESICCYKDLVLMGTKQGFILSYRISFDEKSANNKNYVNSEFRFLLKDFSKKPITQILIVEELGFILSVSDGNVFVHRITDYKHISTISGLRVEKIVCDVFESKESDTGSKKKTVQESLSKNGESQISEYMLKESAKKLEPSLRICLTTKKKLIVMIWSKTESRFEEKDHAIKLLDTVKTTQFFFDHLFIGTKTEYLMINISDGNTKCCFSVGKCQEPFLMRVADMIAMKIDDVVEFVDRFGNLLSSGTLHWSFIPTQLIYHPPFAIALADKCIEVRMISPTLFIQSLTFKCVMMCRYMDRIYVLSDTHVYLLKCRPRQSLVMSYSNERDFESALMLANTAPLVGESAIDSTKINIHLSLNLFKDRQFEKAFNIFTQMLIDPSDVLPLFPSLCPDKITKQARYAAVSKDFTENEVKEAIHALIDYLVKWRYRLRHWKEDNIECKTIFDGKINSVLKKNLEQIVDTSLLKCYLIMNSPLLMSLLKQKNCCHLDEAKKSLIENEKYQELVLLYESHERHNDALDLLLSQSVKAHSPLVGTNPTLRYMKNLNPDHLDLIYEYGDCILTKNPRDWLSIFTYWDHVDRTCPDKDKKKFPSYKESVLKHLKAKAPDMVTPFLERIIFDNKMSEDFEFESDYVDNGSKQARKLSIPKRERKIELLPFNDDEPLPIIAGLSSIVVLHTSYVVSLIGMVLSMRPTSLLTIDIKSELQNPAPDSKDIYRLRMRLKNFLQSEEAKYSHDVLSEFPYDAFYDERAVVLARAAKDEQALTLWIYLLNNWEEAVSHCEKSYKKKKSIFFKLLNICVDPSDPATIGIVVPSQDLAMICNKKSSFSNNRFEPKLDKALEILMKYGDRLSVLPTIKLLSTSFKINDLLPFMQNSLRRQSTMLNQAVYQRNLQFSYKLQSNLKLCHSSRKYFVMEPESKCCHCEKSMGGSALARYPDGSLMHYGCCRDLLKSIF